MPAFVSTGPVSETSNVTTPNFLSAYIKKKAAELGFELARIVPATPLVDERSKLNEWLARGYHGEMNWMARDPSSRTDPRQLLPEARSVVVVANNYYTGARHADDAKTGKVSRYAWGDDYHDVL